MKEKLRKLSILFKNKFSWQNVKKIIYIIAALIGFVGPVLSNLDKIVTFWGKHFPGYTKTEPFDNKDFGVLVTPFCGSTEELATKGIAIQGTIRSTLNARFKELKIDDAKAREIDRKYYTTIESHEQARKIGIKYNADIVIWGDITIAGIIPSITIVNDNYAFSQIIQNESTLLKNSLGNFQLTNNSDIRLYDLTDEPISVISFVTGFKLYNEKKLDEALKYFIESIPKNKTEYLNISSINFYSGNIYFFKNNKSEAIIYYNRAIDSNKENDMAYNNRGAAYFAIGKIEDSFLDYNQALDINSRNALAYNNRGRVYEIKNDIEKAICDYTKAVDIEPNYINAYLNRGFTYQSIHEYQNAILDFKKAIEIDPQNYIAYYNWGTALSDSGNYLESIDKFKKATEVDSNQADVYNNWGFALNELERYEEACNMLQRATELDPELAGAFMSWGDALRHLGKDDDAIIKYRKAIELNPMYRMGAYAPSRYYEVLREF